MNNSFIIWITRNLRRFFQLLLTWQAVAYIVLVILSFLLIKGIINLKELKVGDFDLSFQERASQLNVLNTMAFQGIKNLDEDELKLFLIMGGRDAAYYIFQDRSHTGAAVRDLYARLQQDSLLRFVQRNDSTFIFPTKQGELVHRALIQSIYAQLICGK